MYVLYVGRFKIQTIFIPIHKTQINSYFRETWLMFML